MLPALVAAAVAAVPMIASDNGNDGQQDDEIQLHSSVLRSVAFQ